MSMLKNEQMKRKLDQKRSNACDSTTYGRYFFFFHSLEKLDAKPVKNVSFTVQIILYTTLLRCRVY